MALTQPTSLADWAPHGSVSLFTRLLSYLRSAWINLVHDNPIAWKLGLRGRANAFEDMEGECTVVPPVCALVNRHNSKRAGPFFLIGAPSRQVADGQAVLASPKILNRKPTPPSNPITRPEALTLQQHRHPLQTAPPPT